MSFDSLAINRVFSQQVFKDFINKGYNNTYNSVVRNFINDPESKDNGQLLSEVYQYIATNHRNEYYYQNTLLNKLLLGRHSVNTTTALTQIPIGKSKADFILINGKAVVYEIKTELDTLERLNTQLNDYYKAFDHVCVLTCAGYFEKLNVMLEGTPVGIYVLTRNGTISQKLCKEPVKETRYLDHEVLFRILHKREFEHITERYHGNLPRATPVFYYEKCMDRFKAIPILKAYEMVLSELKTRNRIDVEKFKSVPKEIKSAVYFLNPTRREYERLEHFLQKQFGG